MYLQDIFDKKIYLKFHLQTMLLGPHSQIRKNNIHPAGEPPTPSHQVQILPDQVQKMLRHQQQCGPSDHKRCGYNV